MKPPQPRRWCLVEWVASAYSRRCETWSLSCRGCQNFFMKGKNGRRLTILGRLTQTRASKMNWGGTVSSTTQELFGIFWHTIGQWAVKLCTTTPGAQSGAQRKSKPAPGAASAAGNGWLRRQNWSEDLEGGAKKTWPSRSWRGSEGMRGSMVLYGFLLGFILVVIYIYMWFHIIVLYGFMMFNDVLC